MKVKSVFGQITGLKSIMVFMIVILLSLSFVGFVIQKNFTSRISEQQETIEQLNMQLRNMQLVIGTNGKILTLEKELVDLSKRNKAAGKRDLGVDIPNVAYKVFELEQRYKDDGLEASLLLGIIETESDFDPRATSTYKDASGNVKPLAYGIMQVVRSTASPYLQKLGHTWSPEIMYEPTIALEVGTTHLVELHRQYMDEGLEFTHEWNWSIMSYFWGERPIKDAMNLPSSARRETPAFGYWNRVREAQLRWKAKGF